MNSKKKKDKKHIICFQSHILKNNIYDILLKNYKLKMESILLKKFNFLKGFEDIIGFFLFTLDILLFTRIPNLLKRTKPFINKYKRNFFLLLKTLLYKIQLIFNPNLKELKKDPHAINLSKLPTFIITNICSYLDIASVSSLNIVNKKLHEKTETNIIWYNLYKSFYEKTLLEKEIKLKDSEQITNYKKYCKEVYSIIVYNDKEEMKKYRDKKMGFARIVIEETIESLLRIPNLLLTPWKLFSVILCIITDFFELIFYYINKTKIIFNFVNEEQLRKWENTKYIHDGIYNNFMDYFFDFHIYFFFGLPKLLIYICCTIGSFFFNFILYFIKLLTFSKLCVENNDFSSHQNILDKVNIIPLFNIILQIILGFILNIVHIIILYIPNIFYVYHKFNYSIQINTISDINYLFYKFFDLSFSELFQIIFGIYGSGILIWGIQYHYLYTVVNLIFNKSEIFFYKIISQAHCYHFDVLGITSNYIFPLPKLVYYLNISLMILKYKINSPLFKKICDNVLRIYTYFFISVPFLCSIFAFNYNDLKRSLIICSIINVYAVKNYKKMIKAIDNKKNIIDKNLIFERCYSTYILLYLVLLYIFIYLK